MNKAWKEKWVEALRSGKFTQGEGRLIDTSDAEDEEAGSVVKHCCLGVLCEIGGYPRVQSENGFKYASEHGDFLGAQQVVKFGLDRATQNVLAGMNDEGRSFIDIADYVEKNL